MLGEVSELCAKAAVVPVPTDQQGRGYYSTYFLVPKKDGGVRPILNLKPFNKNVPKQHFKMETLQGILPTLEPGLWLASLDLKDAYFHVPMHPSCHPWLRFAIQGSHYQYRVLPFGLSLAPLVFTRVVQCLVAWMRERGFRVHAYLDDLLIIAHSPAQLTRHLEIVVHTLVSAGFTINLKKSDLLPSQDLVYIGGRLRTDLGRVFLPVERREALIRAVRSFARVGMYHPVRRWLQILGLMAATITTVRHARLRMRPLQLSLRARWRSQNLEEKLMITNEDLLGLSWWTREGNLSRGLPFRPCPHNVVITTDASLEGWGGHLTLGSTSHLFSGLWDVQDRRQHINLLELRAVKLTLCRASHLLRSFSPCVVRAECDNTTAVSYLNKQGGTRSKTLCEEACEIHEWLLDHDMLLSAIHRPGLDNELADFLSRNRPDPLEWSLADDLCLQLWDRWGLPQVDLFASPTNHKLPVWFSRSHCPRAAGTDALAQDWRNLRLYAFPPFNLILRTLCKLRADRAEWAIVITPYWPKRTWFPLAMSMASVPPWTLPRRYNQLSQSLPDKGVLYHPDLHQLKLVAWKLSA